jgi:hypothetical protein
MLDRRLIDWRRKIDDVKKRSTNYTGLHCHENDIKNEKIQRVPPLKSISLVGSYRAFVLGFFDFRKKMNPFKKSNQKQKVFELVDYLYYNNNNNNNQ